MKKHISLFLVVLMVFSIFPHITSVVNATNTIGNITTSPMEPIAVDKVICNATINDNFADDIINKV